MKTPLFALLVTGLAFAQAPAPTPSIAAGLDRETSMIENNLVNAASAMPEDKFNFTPESLNIPGANFKGVYTFAGLVKHVATVNFALTSGATGDKPPAGVTDEKGPASMTSKAEIVQFLKDSFAAVHKAAKGLTPENSAELISGMGPQKTPRIFVVSFVLAHCNDEYGQMVEYLRMNGIIPPASAPRK
jgi:hypothetical protein